jgi:hypothetical protein
MLSLCYPKVDQGVQKVSVKGGYDQRGKAYNNANRGLAHVLAERYSIDRIEMDLIFGGCEGFTRVGMGVLHQGSRVS